MLEDGLFVLKKLAEEQRYVLSTWRAHLLLRRHIDPFYPEKKAERVVGKLDREGLIEPRSMHILYEVTSPYAHKKNYCL